MSEWVSIKDKLPTDDSEVLAILHCCEGRCHARWRVIAHYYEEGWRCSGYIFPNITYWMPLPELPNE